MRLLHVGHADQRSRIVQSHAADERSRRENRARSQSMPLRQLQPCCPRGVARSEVDREAVNLAVTPASGSGLSLPGSLRTNRRLAQWLRFHADGYVEIFSGKVELGQGIGTALAQIAAEELDVAL